MKKRQFLPLILTIFLILSLIQLTSAEENQSNQSQGNFWDNLISGTPAENSTNNTESQTQENYSEPIPVIASKHINLSKEIYQPQETLLAEISGNFFSLSKENIQIYEQGASHQTPVISDLTKQNNKYYFYAALPNKPGNFSLIITNTNYTEMGEIKNQDIIKNFTIQNINSDILSINPGFVLAKENFSIKIKSPFQTLDVNAVLEATGETKTSTIQETNEKIFLFSISGINQKQTNIKITAGDSEYDIPVFMIIKINETSEESKGLGFEPSKLIGTVLAGNITESNIILKNKENYSLANIILSGDSNIEITPSSIEILNPNESAIINLKILIPQDVKNNFSGKITAKSENNTLTLPIYFKITAKQEEVRVQESSCANLGKICNETETCDGETTASLEGSCCLGNCVIQESSIANPLLGVIIILIVVAGVGYIIWKAKNKQNLKSSEDILKDRSKRFQDRMKNKLDFSDDKSEEVSGSLGND